MSEIDRLKIELYKALLHKPTAELTDTEVDIMLALSKDYEIQRALEKK